MGHFEIKEAQGQMKQWTLRSLNLARHYSSSWAMSDYYWGWHSGLNQYSELWPWQQISSPSSL